jgi:hypothetical protein
MEEVQITNWQNGELAVRPIMAAAGLVIALLVCAMSRGTRRPALIAFMLLIVGGLALYWLKMRSMPCGDVATVIMDGESVMAAPPPMPTKIVITNGVGRSKPVAAKPPPAKAPPTASKESAKTETLKADDFYRVERTSRGTYRWQVSGTDWKQTEKAAEEHVLDTARSFVAVHLRELSRGSEYVPSRGEIQRFLRGKPTIAKKDFEDLGELQQATIEFELTSADYQSFLRHVRLEEAAGREWLFTKGFLGVLAFLGTVAGYFRLDEQTKGYYTQWLGIAALAFLTAVGVGISLLP